MNWKRTVIFIKTVRKENRFNFKNRLELLIKNPTFVVTPTISSFSLFGIISVWQTFLLTVFPKYAIVRTSLKSRDSVNYW